jgi:hypothetical protein
MIEEEMSIPLEGYIICPSDDAAAWLVRINFLQSIEIILSIDE